MVDSSCIFLLSLSLSLSSSMYISLSELFSHIQFDSLRCGHDPVLRRELSILS